MKGNPMNPVSRKQNQPPLLKAFGVFFVVCVATYSSSKARSLFAAEDTAKGAATAEEAVKVLDLRTLVLPAGALVESVRQVGTVTYYIKADPKPALQTQQQKFLKLGWKELPGTSAEATYGSALFQKSNFVVSLTTSEGGRPDKPGHSLVSITNFGNIRPAKLPVLKGAKSQYLSESTAMYLTDVKVPDAVAATRKALQDGGWEPYGEASNLPDNVMLTFKRNAIQLMAFVGVAPAQAGKTSITYSTTQLSVDLPAPANAEELQFVDMQKTLRYLSDDEFDVIAKFYLEKLKPHGWKPTTENLVTAKDKFNRPTGMLVFRNAAKDIVTLDLQHRSDKRGVEVTHLTAAEFAEAEKKAKEAAEKQVAETEKAAAAAKAAKKPSIDDEITAALKGSKSGKGKDAVRVILPEKAKKVTQTGNNVLQVQLTAGTAKATVEQVRDQLVADKWKVEGDDDDELDDNAGNLMLTRGAQRVTLTYTDTGVTDATLMLIGIGVNLEPGKADPKPAGKKAND